MKKRTAPAAPPPPTWNIVSAGGRWWCARAKAWTAEPRLATSYPTEQRALDALAKLLGGEIFTEGAKVIP
jgi:hypothetical protein